MNKLFLNDAHYGDRLKILDFIKSKPSGASIDLIRYNIESLTVKDFSEAGYRITDADLKRYKAYALVKVREWRAQYEDTFFFGVPTRLYDRTKAQVLALRWLYRSIVAYRDELNLEEGKVPVYSLSYKDMIGELEKIPFARSLSFKPKEAPFHVFMSGKRNVIKHYIDNYRKALIKIRHYLTNKQYAVGLKLHTLRIFFCYL